MKTVIFILLAFVQLQVTAQITSPKLSPKATLTQTVGLTDIKIAYSRPSVNDRVIFGGLEPFDAIWRTGANENTVISTSDDLIFGTDTLKAGEYAIFTKPSKGKWVVYFYSKTDNWGTPDTWEDELVALEISSPVRILREKVETFTISIDDISTAGATLTFAWDLTKIILPFQVPTSAKMLASINKTMAGPGSGDYYAAADYYLNEKIELKTALVYIDKAIELREGSMPFWMYRKKALIQAELGDYKGAIASAKISMEGAEKANYQSYIDSNKLSIEEWNKK